MTNIASVNYFKEDYEKSDELYERALKGCEARLGKDHKLTKTCANNYCLSLEWQGGTEKLAELKKAHPNIEID